jgi:hypothetical protein
MSVLARSCIDFSIYDLARLNPKNTHITENFRSNLQKGDWQDPELSREIFDVRYF